MFEYRPLVEDLYTKDQTDESIIETLRTLTAAVTDTTYDNEKEIVGAIIDASFMVLDKWHDDLSNTVFNQCISSFADLTSCNYDYASMILKVCILYA